MRVLVAGAYGIRNAGDDLPLLVLREQLPDAELRVLVRHRDPWYDQLGIKQVQNPEHESQHEAQGRHFLGLNRYDNRDNLGNAQEEIAQADILVIGAGNGFTDTSLGLFRGPLELLRLYATLALCAGTPILLYGVGLGPLNTQEGRHLTRWLLQVADCVTVRDWQSSTLARGLTGRADIHELPDACFGLSQPPRRPESMPRGKVLAVGLRDLRRTHGRKGEALLRRLGEALRILAAEGVKIRFITQSHYFEDDDRKVPELLGPVSGAFTCTDELRPLELIALYAGADATLGVRLHSVVFSLMVGTSAVGWAYLPKVRYACERYGTPCLDLTASASQIAAACRRALGQGRQIPAPNWHQQALQYGELVKQTARRT